ncbi:MAG TPA: hypothetical protein VJN72_06315 [Gaiellales bacterium]|nr:hypothetical protein [Gaiellales bacterium]
MAVWYDTATTKANVLAMLRLSATDIDVPRVDQVIPAAAARIEHEVDRVDPLPGPPAPADLQEVLDTCAVAIYHHGSYVATIGTGLSAVPTPAAFDPLDGLQAQLIPYKQQWGIA